MKFLIILNLLLMAALGVMAQSKAEFPVIVDKTVKANFAFSEKWAYPWHVIKQAGGKFENTLGNNISKADTAHLYFTANCKTNVQGGYKLKYCFAAKNKTGIRLNFADGLPAYANEYHVYIQSNKYYFEPELVYPDVVAGQKTTYRVVKSKLILNQQDYDTAKVLSGYIDTEFTETITGPTKTHFTHTYYFRGYFKTKIKS
ncbi:hypothetical protein ACFFGT_32765 [Mucilaginibacter angelicae]|uniref:DUF4468 domain-containing protein n=1 Tax=Mucilaginibacter angelicae TaxID=869718 RepID=A0ABV6LI04_9SPHI